MSGTSTFLDADTIRAVTFVRHVELHETLPSTNDRAIELAASRSIETPALIAARLQTAGRGRGTNTWWSADGALTFSLILDTGEWGIPQRDWPRLSLTTAVAVCDALFEHAPQNTLAIKWPNDVLLDGAKVAGILIESPSIAGQTKDRLVIGTGINVNNSRQAAPQEVQCTGVALCEVAGRRCDVQNVLVGFLKTFEVRLKQLAADDQSLPNQWQHLSWLTDRGVVVAIDGKSLAGRCLGIANDGALLVERAFVTERIYSGSVRAAE
jgi:BirA family transcriptional regulator, biotin operon repressor / biotin---[acetyl-CoA-carboxylase] ligase